MNGAGAGEGSADHGPVAGPQVRQHTLDDRHLLLRVHGPGLAAEGQCSEENRECPDLSTHRSMVRLLGNKHTHTMYKKHIHSLMLHITHTHTHTFTDLDINDGEDRPMV